MPCPYGEGGRMDSSGCPYFRGGENGKLNAYDFCTILRILL